jgi:hypothetical protein
MKSLLWMVGKNLEKGLFLSNEVYWKTDESHLKTVLD